MTFEVEVAREATPAIKSWLAGQRRLLRTPGVQAAIGIGDELIMSVALGSADEPAGVPLRTDHLFRIASHSKTFTATALFQLVEAGRLRLDDAVATHVTELADTSVGRITVRELLGHQGGVIRDGVETDFWQLRLPFPDPAALIALCRDHGAVLETNEHFKYSNVGYSLLGMIIERVDGRTYAESVRARIIEPLGLSNTGPEWDEELTKRYAAGHTGLIDGAEPRLALPHTDTRAMAAATGFYSTAADLTRYAAAHFFGNSTLLSDASKRLMQRDETRVSSHGKEIGRYGLGMDATMIGKRRLVGHSGGYPGHITRTFLDPTDRLVVSVLTNCIGGPAAALATGVIKLLDLAAGDHEPDPTSIDLDRFVGLFASLMGVRQIARLGGRLVSFPTGAADPTEQYEELRVIDESTLQVVAEPGFGSPGERVHLERAADDTISLIRYGGGTGWPVETFLANRAEHVRRASETSRS